MLDVDHPEVAALATAFLPPNRVDVPVSSQNGFRKLDVSYWFRTLPGADPSAAPFTGPMPVISALGISDTRAVST